MLLKYSRGKLYIICLQLLKFNLSLYVICGKFSNIKILLVDYPALVNNFEVSVLFLEGILHLVIHFYFFLINKSK